MRQWRQDAVLRPSEPGYDEDGFPVDLPRNDTPNGNALRLWWRYGAKPYRRSPSPPAPGFGRSGYPLALRGLMMPTGIEDPEANARALVEFADRPNWPGYDGHGIPLGLPGLPADAVASPDGQIDRTFEPWGESSSDGDSGASEARSKTSYLSLGPDTGMRSRASSPEVPSPPPQRSIPSAEPAEPSRPMQWGKGYDPAPSSSHFVRGMFSNIVNPRSNYHPGPADDPERVAAGSEEPLHFERRLWRDYGGSVVYTSKDALKVNIATLQRLKLQRLRKELVVSAFRFKYSPGNLHTPYIDDVLHKYVEALKEYDYMRECAAKGELADPFIVTTKNDHHKALIWQAEAKFRDTLSSPHFLSSQERFLADEFENDLKAAGKQTAGPMPSLMGGNAETRNVVNKRDNIEGFLRRLGMACLGGVFLIGPMLLMVLTGSQLASLVTPSVCVFAFGVAMAVFLDKPFDVLSATAAYAAVLVVFVGTSASTNAEA
ncbi:hypothetical protein QBC34DRAFT_490643 [Podospora aff. communis PSN243]|uniref:DUF6594 domain-containing protein n=1 Tax=Podospora aff. communis PSN243 TaxID=3040156 RepID=A0AAV9GZ19_9PEZI|nr:hypothetical protein QBC34DRAFT_490643 [Podospora aff. communis PSN243]